MGEADTVVANIADKTVLLETASSSTDATTYGGRVKLPLDTSTEQADLQILAQNRYGESDTLTTPLKEVADLPAISAPAPRVPSNQVTTHYDFYTINRYITLGIGFALLLFMLTDLKIIVEKKLTHIDKRVNNFVLLALSLIVVAVMYWL
jgi:hypothetical protein